MDVLLGFIIAAFALAGSPGPAPLVTALAGLFPLPRPPDCHGAAAFGNDRTTSAALPLSRACCCRSATNRIVNLTFAVLLILSVAVALLL